MEKVNEQQDMSEKMMDSEREALAPAAPDVKVEQVPAKPYLVDGKIIGYSIDPDEYAKVMRGYDTLPAAGSAVEDVEVVGWVDPENIERMKRRDLCGFMIEEKEDSRRSCAVMTVAQHERIVASLTRPAQTEQQPVAWADPSDLHRLETGSLNCINVYREKKPCVYEPVFLRAAPVAQTAQQSAPERVSVPVERIKIALEAVQTAMEDAYNNAYQDCCGRGIGECCGNPEPAWSDADQAIMDALAPAQRELSALLASHAKTGKANP